MEQYTLADRWDDLAKYKTTNMSKHGRLGRVNQQTIGFAINSKDSIKHFVAYLCNYKQGWKVPFTQRTEESHVKCV